MAKTGERYSTARRQVLRQLGTVADQPEAPEARPPRRHRVIGAVGLVLAVAVVGAVIVVATERTEGPTDKGPSTVSTSENRHSVSGLASQCRRRSVGVRRVVLDLQAGGATPRDVVECIRLMAGPGWTEVVRDRIRLLARDLTPVSPPRSISAR